MVTGINENFKIPVAYFLISGLKANEKAALTKEVCQTVSNSTADSLDFLRMKGVNEFQGSEATANFFRRINNVFDILNSMRENANGFKRPISPETKNQYFQYFDDSISYIRGIKLSPNGKIILKTAAKTPFMGFIVDMQNFRSFYLEYVESNILPHVLAFRFSQDHLELLFSCIRQMVNSKNVKISIS